MIRYIILTLLLAHIHSVFLFEKVANDFDRYGSKIAFNDRLLVTANNLDVSFNIQLSPFPSETTCKIDTRTSIDQKNEQRATLNSSCDFIYSVVVPKYHPLDTAPYFAYNCVDRFGNNVLGLYMGINNSNSCDFVLKDNRIVPGNYSTQDNFVLCMVSDGSGIYGIADDFILFYNFSSFDIFIVPLAGFGLSPRAFDIISFNNSVDFAIIVGYLQTEDWRAQEMIYLVNLKSIEVIDSFEIPSALVFPLGDPRRNRWVAKSRVYLPQNSVSVSIASHTGLILVGIQSLNAVVMFSLNNRTNRPSLLNISSHVISKKNGISIGYGKSVAWLDEDGHKAAILVNNYSYATYQWISSSVYVYDIAADGFDDSSQPITIYPNSEQILQPKLSPSLIRLVSSFGHVALLDDQGTSFVLLSSPPGTYPTTSTSSSFSIKAPCIPGTYSDQFGIELCIPCSNGSYSTGGALHCSKCKPSNNTYCTYGAVAPINYEDIQIPVEDQSYPESPEGVIFDDILLEMMFKLSRHSAYCSIVSPPTWILIVIGLNLILFVVMGLSAFYASNSSYRERIKIIGKHIDLIGEGKLWAGGAMSIGIVIFLGFSYAFSSFYYQRYPIEKDSSNSWFSCLDDIKNAKFSSSMQILDLSRITDDNNLMYYMLDQQPFTMIIDLINTAFTCNDSIIIQRIFSHKVVSLPIIACNSSYNESIISLTVLLPGRAMKIQLILPGTRTVGLIRVNINGPGQTNENGRITLRQLNSSFFVAFPDTDHILAPSVELVIHMTAVVNQTSPMDLTKRPIFSTEWTLSEDMLLDEIFTVETRYTFHKREKTTITINLVDEVFYVSNVQQPIARRNELIFRTLLFTTVVLELFRLAFLLCKLILVPLFRFSVTRILKKKKQSDSLTDETSNTEIKDTTELKNISVSEDRVTSF